VRDFDEAVTRVTFGFPSVDAYYDASSSRLKIGDVRVPLLVVQAKDDPIAVHSAVPRDVIKGKTTPGPVVLVETESGGHLGWTAGAEAPFGSPWPDVGAMQFFEACRRGVGRMSMDGDVDAAKDAEAGVSAEVGAAEVAVEASAAR
jgi:predicted alpha/beta-fold hydrolase